MIQKLTGQSNQTAVLTTYEDRPADFPGVALLALSLAEACPAVRLVVFGANVPDWFVAFAAQRPQVGLRQNAGFTAAGWSVKPEVLLRLLNEGTAAVTWLDADLLVTAAFAAIQAESTAGRLVVAEEPHWTKLEKPMDRSAAWGWSTQRTFRPGLNSCVVRVDQTHRPLLEEWAALLRHPDYLAAQKLPFSARPLHVAGDQDVLEALLCGPRFANVPVRILRAGDEIAQCHLADGYTAMDRMKYWCGRRPALVHSQGFKPWRSGVARSLDQDVSLYLLTAAGYKHAIPGDVSWIESRTTAGRWLRTVFAGHPAWCGLLPAVWTGLQRRLRIRSRVRSLVGAGRCAASQGLKTTRVNS